MISINHRLFGRWLPTYFFAEDPEQIPFGLCFWVSRCYFDPALMQKSGYTVLLSRWWRTLFTDLTLPLETIYQSFDKKSTRYPLNVAQRLLSVGRWQVVPPMKHQDDDDRLIVDFYRRKHLGENDTVEKLKASPTRPYWLTSRAFTKDVLCSCEPISVIRVLASHGRCMLSLRSYPQRSNKRRGTSADGCAGKRFSTSRKKVIAFMIGEVLVSTAN